MSQPPSSYEPYRPHNEEASNPFVDPDPPKVHSGNDHAYEMNDNYPGPGADNPSRPMMPGPERGFRADLEDGNTYQFQGEGKPAKEKRVVRYCCMEMPLSVFIVLMIIKLALAVAIIILAVRRTNSNP